MNKIIIYILVVIALLIVGFFALNSYIYNEKQGDNPETSEYTGS